MILHSHFSWQAQNLVMLERDFSWQAQHLVMLECLFSWPGAAFGEIWVDSRSETCLNFQYKMPLRTAECNLRERAGAR